MSAVTYSDCFPDLLCCEDSESLSGESPARSVSEKSVVADLIEESIDELIEDERCFACGIDYFARYQSESLDASAREESVLWMLKVQRYYGFQPLTAYLAVNYMDRFLDSRCLPETNGWPMQLLTLACLSLAAKMEELLVPSLLDLQVENAKFIFEPRTVQRMELLVLSALNWRLRSITPFNFLGSFSYKLDPSGTYSGFLISRATEIILSNIHEASLLEYWPSCIAVAAILCAVDEIPFLCIENPAIAESWCNGLSKEKINGCYRLMRDVVVIKNSLVIKRFSKAMPQLRVTTRSSLRFSNTNDSSASSSSSSSYSSSTASNKRRRLNNLLWVDDDKENSE